MSGEGNEDSAWIRVGSGLTVAELAALSRDVERLLRINSMYEFEEWRPQGKGRFLMRARNLSNGRIVETAIRATAIAHGTRIEYETGLKKATEFRVEAPAENRPRGAVLFVRDDYAGTPEAERRERADEIDRSLVVWGHDLHRYLRQWALWSWFGPWRWYMHRVWQPMRPKARRIAFILIAVTLFEAAVGIFLVAVLAASL